MGIFGKLFGKEEAKAPPAKAERLAPAITSAIYEVVGQGGIPLMPGAAQKAFRLSVDPNAEARDFVEVIESDEGLSARVVKIANSVYFDRGKKCESIDDSVNVIGINELRCLLNATTLSDIFPSRHSARTQLWANDIATAITARSLARRALPGKEDAAFLGGLMHDIGKLLLLQRAEADYKQVLSLVERRGIDFVTAEEEVFLFNHTQVGQLIGERWSFTDELIQVIRNHHQAFPQTTPQQPTLPQLIQCADIIAHSLGLGHPKGFARFKNVNQERLDEVWRVLKIPQTDGKSALSETEKTFNLEYDLYSGKGG